MLKAAALICPRPVHVPLDLPDLLPSASCRSERLAIGETLHRRPLQGRSSKAQLVEAVSLWNRTTGQPSRNSRRRKPAMRYALILSIGLVATMAFAWSAAAVENAHELAARGTRAGLSCS